MGRVKKKSKSVSLFNVCELRNQALFTYGANSPMCCCYFCKLGLTGKHNNVCVGEDVTVQICQHFFKSLLHSCTFANYKPGQWKWKLL